MCVYTYADVCIYMGPHWCTDEGRMRVAYAAYKRIYARKQGSPFTSLSPSTDTTSNFSLNSPIESAKIETSA